MKKYYYYIIAFVISFLIIGIFTANTQEIQQKPTFTEMDSVRIWLRQNTPNGYNRDNRRGKMAIIQAACDWFEQPTWREYRTSWYNDKTKVISMEEEHPALYFLRTTSLQAFEDIHNTEVSKGMAVWLIYNMGYVFKTPESCFGIDIHIREAERLVDDLDFLLITHKHPDHITEQLLNAMIAAEKPVITNWYEGSTIVNEACILNFGNIRVKVDIGDHKQDASNPILMYQIDCVELSNNITIYHSGDNGNMRKILPDKEVTIFIPHISTEWDDEKVSNAIEYIKPRITLLSHILELDHSPIPSRDWRFSYDFSFEQIKDIPENETMILTWGERWLAPGTLLDEK